VSLSSAARPQIVDPIGDFLTDGGQLEELLLDRWRLGRRRECALMLGVFAQVVGIMKHAQMPCLRIKSTFASK